MIGPCDDCGGEAFLRCEGDLCSECYIPDRPTFGWCLSEVKRRGHQITGLKKKELEREVYKLLGMNMKGEWKNESISRKARAITKRLYGGFVQVESNQTDR